MTIRKGTRKVRGERTTANRETLDQKLERILAEPVGAPFPKLTKREARAMLRKLSERPPDLVLPPGDEVVKKFYGLWPDPEDDSYPP